MRLTGNFSGEFPEFLDIFFHSDDDDDPIFVNFLR